jgi:hypothetical protein
MNYDKKIEGELKSLKLISIMIIKDILLRHNNIEKKQISQTKKLLKESEISFERSYQEWYSKAIEVVKHFSPSRLDEFTELYKSNLKNREVNAETYSIYDYLRGMQSNPEHPHHFNGFSVASMRFNLQNGILQSAILSKDSSLFNIRKLIEVDFIDSEIDQAKELLKNGYLRAAGVICGVVLEKHLKSVCVTHNLPIPQKPTLSNFNELLKNNNIIDITVWRHLALLADWRNLCSHGKDREPTKEEVSDLIDGVKKIIKTVY